MAACQDAPTSAACERVLQEAEESLLHRRPTGPDANLRLGGCVDVRAERLCGRGHEDRRRGRGGQFRAGKQSASGRQRRWPQLPGHLQLGGLAADLDAGDEQHRPARRVCRPGLRGETSAAAGGHSRGRRDLDASLRCGDDQRRPLRSRWRLHDGRCRGTHSKRRIWQLLKELWPGRGGSAGSRGGDRRWRGADRQCLHESGFVLGTQRGWRRQPGRRHPSHAQDARTPRILRRSFRDDQSQVGCRFPQADGADHRFLPRPLVQSLTGASRSSFERGNTHRDFHGVPRAEPATGGECLAPVSRLGGRVAAGLFHRGGSDDLGCAGATFLGLPS